MRILLILLSLVLQWNVSGNSVNIPTENCVQKTLNVENSAADFDCPFRWQGQYHDSETGLYYNRFRYYDPDTGNYISQDPIRLLSGEGNFYAYVKDPNNWIDIFGLSGTHLHHTIPREIYNPRSGRPPLLPEHLAKDPDIKGRPGNPNRWSVPADEHIALHKKNRPGGDYNTRWKQELENLRTRVPNEKDWKKGDILDIRDKLTKEFGIDKHKPSCKS
jgi:RHS repeat-associated protein